MGASTRALGALAAALMLWAPARAAVPALEDPEATVVKELVIRAAPASGPAWWTAERGGSVIHILGLPDEPVPKAVRWDQGALQRNLAGANVMIVPVVATAGLGDIPAFLRMRSRLKSKTPMEAGLPEPLRARFVAARTRLGKPASRYAGWDPIYAGQLLVNDLEDAAKVTRREPMAAIQSQANRQNVRARPAAKFRVVALLDPAIKGLTPEISRACLAEALDEVDAGTGALTAAGTAWARGDLAGVLSGPRGFASCLLLLQGGAAFWRQTMAEAADAVAEASQKPGHSVAVFQIRALVAEDGILERLKAKGFKVTGGGG
jgi:hypothetical protein